MGTLLQPGTVGGIAHHNAGGMQVVVERPPLTEEFRGEEDCLKAQLPADSVSKSYGNGGLDDDGGLGIHQSHRLYDGLDARGVKEILVRVIVGGGGDDHEFCLGTLRTCSSKGVYTLQ